MNVNINYPVTHIRQQDENYCWACSFAMILNGRTWQDALRLVNRVPARFRNPDTGGLEDVRGAALALRLSCDSAWGITPQILAQRMRRGPVAMFGIYHTIKVFQHAVVINTLRGDLSNPGTLIVGIHDPWANGNQWRGTWNQWAMGPNRILVRADWVVGR